MLRLTEIEVSSRPQGDKQKIEPIGLPSQHLREDAELYPMTESTSGTDVASLDCQG